MPTLGVRLKPVPLVELADRLGDAICTALDGCCASSGRGGTLSDCRSVFSAEYATQLDKVSALAVEYDPFRAAACVEHAAARLNGCSYAGLLVHQQTCASAFRGTRSVGETCAEDKECRPENGKPTYCAGRLSGSQTCQLTLGQGDSCLLEGCAEGLFCDFETLTCQPQRALGGDCSLQIDACATESACSPAFICEPKLADGEECQLSLQCESGACSGTCVDTFADGSLCSG